MSVRDAAGRATYHAPAQHLPAAHTARSQVIAVGGQPYGMQAGAANSWRHSPTTNSSGGVAFRLTLFPDHRPAAEALKRVNSHESTSPYGRSSAALVQLGGGQGSTKIEKLQGGVSGSVKT